TRFSRDWSSDVLFRSADRLAAERVRDGYARGNIHGPRLHRRRRDVRAHLHEGLRRTHAVTARDDLAYAGDLDAERVGDRVRLNPGLRDGETHRLGACLRIVPRPKRNALE